MYVDDQRQQRWQQSNKVETKIYSEFLARVLMGGGGLSTYRMLYEEKSATRSLCCGTQHFCSSAYDAIDVFQGEFIESIFVVFLIRRLIVYPQWDTFENFRAPEEHLFVRFVLNEPDIMSVVIWKSPTPFVIHAACRNKWICSSEPFQFADSIIRFWAVQTNSSI